MYIRETITPTGNQYVAKLELDNGTTNPVSAVELEKLAQFGQLRVNTGGVLSSGEGPSITLPDRYLYLPRDFPVQAVFSIDDHGALADNYAAAWVTLVKGNLSTALTALLAKTATVTSAVTKLPL